MPRTLILPSGATLIADPRQDSPSFAISIWFPYGSRNETPATRGFVHFIEHMLFKGTTRHDAASLWRSAERVGGYANGFTERDSLCVYSCVPAEDWRLAAELIVEVVFSSIFPPEEFTKEKRVIVSEILQLEDDVEETGFDAFLSLFWPGQAQSWTIAGNREEAERVELAELYRFYRSVFVPKNAVVVATGAFDLNELAEAVQKAINAAEIEVSALVGAAALADPRMVAINPGSPRARRFDGYRRAAASQVYYFDAMQPEAPFAETDYYALGVLNSAWGEASTSRLFQRIREKMGIEIGRALV
jgi:predicted Zn-dependent peptidase